MSDPLCGPYRRGPGSHQRLCLWLAGGGGSRAGCAGVPGCSTLAYRPYASAWRVPVCECRCVVPRRARAVRPSGREWSHRGDRRRAGPGGERGGMRLPIAIRTVPVRLSHRDAPPPPSRGCVQGVCARVPTPGRGVAVGPGRGAIGVGGVSTRLTGGYTS
eukprot:4265206-Prymnesium_polylepis.2